MPPKENGVWVQNAAGEWIKIGDLAAPFSIEYPLASVTPPGPSPFYTTPTLTPDTNHDTLHLTGTLDHDSPLRELARLKLEADLARSTYERPSDDELRARLRSEFGI